jgi:hypothetical protein
MNSSVLCTPDDRKFSSISTKLLEDRLALSHVYNKVTIDIFRSLRTISEFVCKGS